jgi:DNA (cytosine-5)-methyltransferase 1
MSELVIDNFAGGGGASTGIEAALGRPVDIAINHDAEAIAMHRVNHPHTRHFQTSVWDVDPRTLSRGRQVGLGWFSPDCTYFSKAKGGKPFRDRNPARRRRGLAGIVPRWLDATGMLVFALENVEEFVDWGPLLPDGRVCPKRRGMHFRRWHRAIENIVSRVTRLPYRVDMRELRAHEHGAPTDRKRLFVVGRCDGQEIVFPEPTHGPGLLPYRTAAECIDWSVPCVSIFEREALGKKPLVEATLRRIARGVVRYVINNPRRFIAPIPVSSSNHALAVATLINTRNGERHGQHGEQAPRIRDILYPQPTITAQGSQGALVTAFVARHYGGNTNDGMPLARALSTVTTKDHHALVTAFLLKYYGTDQNPRILDPLHTITTKDRFALVTVHGEPYYIRDIQTRHFTPRELYLAQSFPADYIIDHGIDERGRIIELSKAAQTHMCGNSVPPAMAEALVRANYIEQREELAA